MRDLLTKTEANGQQNGNDWQRFQLLWAILYWLAVAAAAFLGWQNSPSLLEIGLCTVLFAAHAALFFWGDRTGNGRVNLTFATLVMALSIIIWFYLVRLTPAYYLILFGLFSQLYIMLPLRFAAVGSIVIVSLMGYNETIGSGEPFTWQETFIYLLMGIASVTLGAWINTIIHRSEERRVLLEQLQETQADLAEAERQAGVLAERQRLAHEIHDTLAQGFISIIMNLETAEQSLHDPNSEAAQQIQHAKETARHNLQEARRVVADLRPESLENDSLPAALERTVQRWSQKRNIAAAMQTTGTPLPLHPDVDVTLLRATQEALANIHKHAQAQNVTVTLSYVGDSVLLDVQDDGVGIKDAKPSPFGGGFGLQAMRERIAQFGGNLLLESEPGAGTTLVVSIPIRD